MSTTAIKFGALAIKTLAKPIASRIKHQAREHPRFRKVCISVAQRIHQVDVRLRLGLLQDTAAFIKAEYAEREAARQITKKATEKNAIFPADFGTVSSIKPIPPPAVFGDPRPPPLKEPAKRARVRPLSESKAIESGANFISEFFLFAVAGSLILAEQIRVRRKEANRRDVIAERLELLGDRTRQDGERLAELEARSHRDEEQILALEEDNWRLKGGNGVFPGRKIAEGRERKIIEPTPLWEEVSENGTSLWARVWGFGRKVEEKAGVGDAFEKTLVVLTEEPKFNGEASPMEHKNEATSPARSPAVIKKIRPINPEPAPSHSSR